MLKEELDLHGKKVYICGTLSVMFGNTAEVLYAGMDDAFKRYMAPYLTWYHTIQACFDRGFEWCNMGGIEGSLDGGLTKFKSNFHPTILEYVGEFDFPVNKLLFKASQIAFKLRKKMH